MFMQHLLRSLGLGFYETHPKKVWFKKYCMGKGPGGGLDAEDRCCAVSRGEGSADTKVTGSTPAPLRSGSFRHLAATGARSSRDVPVIWGGKQRGSTLSKPEWDPPSFPQHLHPDVLELQTPFLLSPRQRLQLVS